jgi:hypothetical protein
MLCYEDALPFLRSSMGYTVLFSALLFGSYFLIRRFSAKTAGVLG